MEIETEKSPPILHATGVTKIYGEGVDRVVAVADVELALHGGHIYSLLGPNGAGKTTLLRIFATLLAPTRGAVRFQSFDTQADAREIRARLGYLSATTGVYPRLTPDELMRYFGRLYGLSDADIAARTAAVFAQLGIEDYRNRPIGKLSTGMRQKVSIARTILPDPTFLILDEPTNGLDVVVRQSLLDLLRDLVRPDRLIIISTHDLPEAEELCDRHVMIDEGRVVAAGTQSELGEGESRSLREIFFRAVKHPKEG